MNLIVKGNAEVFLRDGMLTAKGATSSLKGDTLTISGGGMINGTISQVFGRGGKYSISGGTFSQIGSGCISGNIGSGGTYISNRSSGSVQIGKSVSISNGTLKVDTLSGNITKVVINGKTVDLEDFGGEDIAEKPPLELDVDEISNISVQENGVVYICDERAVSKDVLSINVAGNGSVHFDFGDVLSSLTASISGSGEIHGNKTRVKNMVASVSGSGDIMSFRITKCGSLVCCGSGVISVSKTKKALVTKNCSGSGNIIVSN